MLDASLKDVQFPSTELNFIIRHIVVLSWNENINVIHAFVQFAENKHSVLLFSAKFHKKVAVEWRRIVEEIHCYTKTEIAFNFSFQRELKFLQCQNCKKWTVFKMGPAFQCDWKTEKLATSMSIQNDFSWVHFSDMSCYCTLPPFSNFSRAVFALHVAYNAFNGSNSKVERCLQNWSGFYCEVAHFGDCWLICYKYVKNFLKMQVCRKSSIILLLLILLSTEFCNRKKLIKKLYQSYWRCRNLIYNTPTPEGFFAKIINSIPEFTA